MSKNNKSTPSVDEQIAALEAQKAALLEKKQNEETARVNALAAKINELPKLLGVDNLEAVSALIVRARKGTLGSLNPTATTGMRTRAEVTDEQKAAAIEAYRTGKKQRSEIVAELGIHSQTLHNWLDAAGLVNKRGQAATPAAAAPAATAGATA